MDKYTATEQAFKHGYEKGYEAAKKEAESEILILKQKRANIFEIANAYERGFDAAKAKWIPASERLPTEEDANEEGVVLVHNIGCPMYEAMDWDQVEMFSTISHWMPLPEPPKEGE